VKLQSDAAFLLYPNWSTLTSIFSASSYRIFLIFDSKKKLVFFSLIYINCLREIWLDRGVVVQQSLPLPCRGDFPVSWGEHVLRTPDRHKVHLFFLTLPFNSKTLPRCLFANSLQERRWTQRSVSLSPTCQCFSRAPPGPECYNLKLQTSLRVSSPRTTTNGRITRGKVHHQNPPTLKIHPKSAKYCS
jgi:hypothetical protein